MKTLPLFFHPSRWLLVDDDRSFLDTLIQALGEQNQLIAFNSPLECAAYLKTYQPFLSKKNFLKSNTSNEDFGILKHTPIDFDVTSLINLLDNPDRYNEITVMATDYNMPEIDGLALAQLAQDLPIQKILLTGEAKEAQTISAFNKELIQRFLQKGEAGIQKTLAVYLNELSVQYFQKISQPLLSCLETEAKLPLSDPIFVAFFENYCKTKNIKEYYLIDKQGSFLCVDGHGQQTCLVVQTAAGLEAWLATYSEGSVVPLDVVSTVKNRKKIPFFGVGKEAWEVDVSQGQQHFLTPALLQGREDYYWAEIGV